MVTAQVFLAATGTPLGCSSQEVVATAAQCPSNRWNVTATITDSEAQLGQLLVNTGLLTESSLNACLTFARSFHQPLGAVLSLTNKVTTENVQRAVDVQTMIRNGLSPSFGRMVLRYANIMNLSAQEAFNEFELNQEISPLDCWLSQVIPSSNILSETVLQSLQRRAQQAQTSWMKYAVENEILGIEVLSAAMHAVVLMDQGHLEFGDAHALIRAVHANPDNLVVLLRAFYSKHSFDRDNVNLSALLYMAGTLTERNALDVLSLAYRQNVSPIDLIVEHDLLTDQQYRQALASTEMMQQGMSLRWAIAKLKTRNTVADLENARQLRQTHCATRNATG